MPEKMLSFLAEAARTAREDAGRRQVHIAASASMDQSTITKFEAGRAWPRDPDRIVAAYADDLDIDQRELWRRALDLWDATRNTA